MSSSTPASGSGGEAASSASAIVAEAVTGSHLLNINGYSLTKGLGIGNFLKSGTFSVGGHRWYIRYYPDGDGLDNVDWISLFVHHDHTDDVDVKARHKFSVLDETGEPVLLFTQRGPFDTFTTNNPCWGFRKFVQREALEQSACLKDDILRLKCELTVKKEIRTEATTTKFVIVPPSNMHRRFAGLLQDGHGVDVTFQVAGKMFSAHRYVLAARSSVFKAELVGPMKEKDMNSIRIHDMEPRVFKAMLHFIYTDTMPDIDKEEALVITQHLLVAADRYDLERLKLMCEDKLCDYIDTSTVATTLALAEQHGCHGLKKACFNFLKSRSNLKAAMANEGFDHLMSSCPSVIKEQLIKGAHYP